MIEESQKGQGHQTFFEKGQRVNALGPAGHTISITTVGLYNRGGKAALDNL